MAAHILEESASTLYWIDGGGVAGSDETGLEIQ